MKKQLQKQMRIFFLVSFLAMPFFLLGQITSLADAQGKPAGTYTFNFGDGDFQAYLDADGWMLWLQYHHKGGTNPNTRAINTGNSLPIFDSSGLGTDLSTNTSKWGHGSQVFAASIPDKELWLRWEGETSHHNRKIHFESPVLGRFQSDSNGPFSPELKTNHILRDDHTANLPGFPNGTSGASFGDRALLGGPFVAFNQYAWEVRSGGSRWSVDDVRDSNDELIRFEYNTIHRVWVKPVTFNSNLLLGTLNDLQDYINGVQTFTLQELEQIKNIIFIYGNQLGSSKAIINKAYSVINDYDAKIGPLFTSPETKNGVLKNTSNSLSLNFHTAMIALQQGLFDFAFTPEVYAQFPELIDGVKLNTSISFPGAVDPPTDPNVENTVQIRANFQDPEGLNPSYDINSDNTKHAFRPTGLYLAPGSIVSITVPSSLVGKDYYVRVGAHEWDLGNKPSYKRLDRISKKFPIEKSTIEVYNPLGGAIGILVPYGAAEGIVEVTVINAVEAPFFSLKSFYKTPNFEAELEKPGPWAVFETDNVMYTVPKHSIVPGKYDLKKKLQEWDIALQAINSILSRQIIPEKHDLYMISDLFIRGPAYSIGYPQSNNTMNYSKVPGNTHFIDGPGPKYAVNFHEYGHAIRISKFPGGTEAIVNFLYVMAFNYGFGQDLDTAVPDSFGPYTYNLDRIAINRLTANTFGTERDISNTPENEARYQFRGYATYFETVNLIGWCALRNFWQKEFIDLENGLDHGINNQDIDSRILRLSIAASQDLRPLYHVYGIVPQNQVALQQAITSNNLLPSLSVYNRLQEYLNLIPKNNEEYTDYALQLYPKLYSEGPSRDVRYGVGFFYQKSLTYTASEAAERTAILEGIIDMYYPNGKPLSSVSEDCCMNNDKSIEFINGEVLVTGGNPPYDITVETLGDEKIVKVEDFSGCTVMETFPSLSITELNTDAVLIFPNPTSGKLYFNITDDNSQIIEAQLITTTGQIINGVLQTGRLVDLSSVNDGIYILKIKLNNGLLIHKRIVVLK